MVDLNIKVPAIEKLLDYTASGIGAIAGPMLAPWKASREGEAKLILARKDAAARIIQAESEGESLKIIAKAQSEAKELYIEVQKKEESLRTLEISRNDITQRIEFQEHKRLANIENVVKEAANTLADEKVADHEPDPDWTARFFNCAQDVSSEDMQRIWAKILAGEVERPGKTSLRTMNILRNMTRRDAELLESMLDFVIGNDFMFYEQGTESPKTINFGNLLHLEDCGLVDTTALTRELRWESPKRQAFTYHENALEIAGSINAKEALKIPAIRLTNSCKELSQVVQHTNIIQMEYLQDFSRFLQTKDCQLFYLEIIEALPDEFEYSNRIKIEPKSEQPKESVK